MKIKKYIAIVLMLFSLFLAPVQTYAQTKPWTELEGDLNTVCVDNGVATIQGLMCLVGNVLSVALSFIGLAGFIMLIFGSIKWLISGGNSQALESSKKTITFAFTGLILALVSILIINTIAQFTGVNVIKDFFIPPSNTGMQGGPEW